MGNLMIDTSRVSAMHFSQFLESFERISSEVDKLAVLIKHQFIDYLNQSKHQFVETEGVISYFDIDNGYLTNTICISFKLIKKPKIKKEIGYLNFIISLSGEGANQYDSSIREPLIHVEFTLWPIEELGGAFHHPAKRNRYIEDVDYCKTKIENNVITMHCKDFPNDDSDDLELLMFVFSLRLFSINGGNLEDILFKPTKEAILKYVLNDEDISIITLDEYAALDIPSIKADSDEIKPFDFEYLRLVVNYISTNNSFSFGEIQKELKIGRTRLKKALEVLIGKELITQITNEQFELLEGMDERLKIDGLSHSFY